MSSVAPDYDREIPLPEIQTELRNLRAEIERQRARWAQEFTRAEGLERQLRQAQMAATDWQSIALNNGEDRARANVARARAESSEADLHARCATLERERDAYREFARYVVRDWIDNYAHRKRIDLSWISEWIADGSLDLTTECDACGGSERVGDVEFVGDPADAHGYREREIETDCDECYRGRVGVEQ